MDDLLTENDKGQELYADSAYVGLEETLENIWGEGPDMRKGLQRPSADGRAEGEQQAEIQDAQPCGTSVRLYGMCHEQIVCPHHRISKGSDHNRNDQSCL